MVWVIDGTCLKRDYPRFLKGRKDFRMINKQGICFVNFPDECLPSAWLGSSVPVIFDFKGTETINDPRDLRNHLYYLFPKANEREAIVAIVSRESFINSIITGELFKQQEPQKQIVKQPIKSSSNVRERQSQYVYNQGRLVKRRRF